MKGMNELHLNTATMIEILQMWIDMDMPIDKPKVINIKPVDDKYYGCTMFVVELESELLSSVNQ